MKKYIFDYIKNIDNILKKKPKDINKIKEEHLIKIQFFQHERLIHLLVTLFYCLFMLIFMALCAIFIGFFIIGLILLIFVIFYIIHYFRLENSVQYLYKQYDKMNEIK